MLVLNDKGENAMLRKAFLILTAFVIAALVCAGPALAQQQKDANGMNDVQPPNFGPLGDAGCAVGEAISDLRVTIQVSHSWVGDMDFTLTHEDTGSSAVIIDRPGYTTSGFGCSGNDIDAILHDGAAGGDVEDQCDAGEPTINGEFTPSPDPLSTFAGEDLTGSWTLAITDNAAGDSGSLNTWCLAEGTGGVCCSSPGTPIADNSISDTLVLGGGDDGGGDVPATSTWGVIVLMALFMGVSLYFLRRRSSASA